MVANDIILLDGCLQTSYQLHKHTKSVVYQFCVRIQTLRSNWLNALIELTCHRTSSLLNSLIYFITKKLKNIINSVKYYQLQDNEIVLSNCILDSQIHQIVTDLSNSPQMPGRCRTVYHSQPPVPVS